MSTWKCCAAAAALMLTLTAVPVCAEEAAPEAVVTVDNGTVCFQDTLSGQVTVCAKGSYTSDFSDDGYYFTPESDGVYVVSLILPNKEKEFIAVESYLVTAADGSVTAELYDIDTEAEPDSEEWESKYHASVNAALQSDFYFTSHMQCINAMTGETYTDTALIILTEPNSGTTVHLSAYDGIQMKQFFTADSPENLLTDTVKGKYIAYSITVNRYADEPISDGVVTVVKENAKSCGMLGIQIKDLTIVPGVYPKPIGMLRGDCNLDGERSLADLMLLHEYLRGDDQLICWHGADINGDKHINAKDITLMKRLLKKLSAG